MEITKDTVVVVTGGASGIGYALAEAFGGAGARLMLADVQRDALDAAAVRLRERGIDVATQVVDVSDEAQVQALAAATIEHFGAVHVVCNNAGVAGGGDPWFGPITGWQWVMGVNFWGVVHGVRAFLPHLVGGGHIVNTASIAGLYPGFAPAYDASKHAVVAITEGLYNTMQTAGLPVGVSCLCPGWVRTGILDSDRNWPAALGELPAPAPGSEVSRKYVQRAIDEGMQPGAVADLVLDAVRAQRFWVFPHPDFVDIAARRWATIEAGSDPLPPEQMPGMPPRAQIMAEVLAALQG